MQEKRLTLPGGREKILSGKAVYLMAYATLPPAASYLFTTLLLHKAVVMTFLQLKGADVLGIRPIPVRCKLLFSCDYFESLYHYIYLSSLLSEVNTFFLIEADTVPN